VFVAAIHKLLFFLPALSMDLSVLLAMLSLTFSGITWPTDMFPGWIAAVSYAMPFRPFAQAFQIFIHGSVVLEDLEPYVYAMFIQCAVYFVLAMVMTFTVALFFSKKEVTR
jgi:ABC-type multidrug transport system permease subunit